MINPFYKRLVCISSFFYFFIVSVTPAFASANISDSYIERMKKVYSFRTETLDGMDWFVVFGMAIASVIMLIVFCYLLSCIIIRFYKIQRGKAAIADKTYWIRMIVSLVILFALMSGTIFVILEKLYGGVVS